MEIILSIIVLICSSFLKNIQNTYIIKKKEEDDDTELKVDDMGHDFDHEDEDKLLNPPELTK